MRRAYLPLLLLFLTVPTCGSVPQFAAADGTFVIGAELPPFPTWAPTRNGPVKIVLVKNLTCNHEKADGCYVFATRDILIEERLPHVLRWRILKHELTHAAIHAKGVKIEGQVEQDVAEAMADQGIAEMVSGWPR